MEVWNFVKADRNSLNKLKRISIRNRSWFRELSLAQRRFIELVIMVVERIRSRLLLRLLAPLVTKLLTALGKYSVKERLTLMGEAAYRMMRAVAEKISRIAQGWGNKSAVKWPEDAGFIRYLTIMELYKP